MRKLLFASAAFLLMTMAANAQKVVKGKVTDDQGKPVSSASVTVKGTKVGTTTDENGNYTITLPSGATTIVISSVNLTEKTINVGSLNVINVSLNAETTQMDEVVVVAYGSVKKSDFTGSATTITAKEIENRPISNPLQALQGAAPGIQTTTPSGAPGSSPGIMIRGIGSYTLGSGPLYVVDGAIYDAGFSNFNPDDIETISVLKDAATTSLYGSRGANGVVMITTKKGTKGRQSLNVKGQMGFSNPAIGAYNTVNAHQYYPMLWEAYRNGMQYGSNIPVDIANQLASGTYPRFTSGANAGKQNYNGAAYNDIYQYTGMYNPFNVGNTEIVGIDGKINPNASLLYADDLDWIKQGSRTGTRNEYTISFSSAGDKYDLQASGSYLKDNGWGLRSSMDRFTGRINANVQATKWFKGGINLSANRTTFNYSATSGIVNPFYFGRYIAPIYPVHLHDKTTGEIMYDDAGNKRFDYGNIAALGYDRPYNSGRHAIAEHLWNKDQEIRDVISARFFGEATITSWLKFTTNFSTDITNIHNQTYQNPIVGDGMPSGRFSNEYNKYNSYTFNQLLNINKNFGKHHFDAVLGHEFYAYTSTAMYGMRQGQAFDDFYVFSNFTDINSLTSSLNENSVEGYFSRLNYNYDGKYFLSGSVRRDGTSKFPRDLRWADFWSVSGGWRLDKEAFFNLSWVNMLKLRSSYGKVGNSNTSNYPYQANYGFFNNGSFSGVAMTQLESPNLTWESQKMFDAGVDFELFRGRLSGTLEYFNRKSDGLIFSITSPYQHGGTTSGSFSTTKNVGNMLNEGLELSLTGQIIRKKDFNWSLTVNGTSFRNKMTKLPDDQKFIESAPFAREEGKSVYDFYTRTWYGVDPENGRAMYLGVITYDPLNAETKIIQNGKGGQDTVTYNFNNARRDFVGETSIPKIYGSVVNNFTYKNFGIGFTLTFQIGGKVYDGVYNSLMTAGTAGRTFHTDAMNRWQKPGDITNVPRLDDRQSPNFNATSTRWLTSASYLSINNINFTYNLGKEIASKFHASSARIFVSAENLKFFTARKGMNVNGSFAGTTGDSYDAARVINFGINLNF